MSDTKGIIFVFEKKQARKFVDSINSDLEIKVVCGNNEIKWTLSDLKHECLTTNEYTDSDAIFQKSLNWIKTWPDKKIWNDKSFKELLVYEGISIFWYLENRLYWHRIQELLLLIERIKQVLAEEKPNKIWLKGSKEIQFIISNLYKKPIEKFECLEPSKLESKITQKSYGGFPTLKLLALKLFRGVSPFSKSKLSRNNGKTIMVITEVSNWRRDFDYNTKKYVERDVLFHDIVKKLLNLSKKVLVVDFENRPHKLLGAYSVNKKRVKSFGVPVRPWECYIDMEIIKKSKKGYEKFLKMWEKVKNSNDFVKSLTYEDVSLYDLVIKDLDHLFRTFKAFTAITMIESAKKIIEIERPVVIIMHDEYGAIQMSLINEANKKGIPTLSLQHGLISGQIFPYVHKIDHVRNENRILNFPLPNKLCVWSENAKKTLIKYGNFLPDVPIVTGDPKLDFLPEVIKLFDFDKIKKKLNIPKNKKIILFITENLSNQDEKILITKSVVQAMKSIIEGYLVIKLHPNESNFDFYHKLVTEQKISEYTVLKDESLYELLYIANVVIVSFSTVGVEAMRMEKPVISLNLLGLHNDASIIRRNIAFVVRKQEELLPTIQKCLKKDQIHERIENAKSFAEEELGLIDGKATERIIEQIMNLKKSNNLV